MYFSSPSKFSLLTLAIAAVSLPGAETYAQQQVDEIIVTASRTERPLNTIPNTVTVINEEALATQIGINNDLSTVLGNMIPSFSPSRQKLTSAGESLRGRDPLYMVDGVPQSNPLRDGSRDGHTIDPLMLERVEVIHGANAIHGVGASGGIINLITRSPEEGELRQRIRLETFGQEEDLGESLGYGMNYSLSGAHNDFDFLGSLSLRSNGINYDPDGRVIGFDNAQGDTMDADTVNLFLKGGYDWDDQRLALTFNHYELEGNHGWVGVNGDIANGVPTTAVEGFIPGEPVSNEVTMLGLNYSNAEFFGQSLQIQAFNQDFAGTYGGGTFATFQDPAFGAAVFDQSQNNSEKHGVKLTLVKDEIGGQAVSLVYGLDYLNDKTYQQLVLTGRNWVPESNYANTALFAQAEFTGVEDLTVTAGVRHERSNLEVDDFTTLFSYNGGQFVSGGEPDFSETLFNLGATYNFTAGWRGYANVSEGFSMPDVGRVLRGINIPGQDVETFLNLEPIITDNAEIGVEYNADAVSAQLSYYVSDSDLGQRLQANVDGIYMVQREKMEIDGLELRLEWLATSDDTFGLRYAHTDGQYDSDDNDSVDTDLSGANMTPARLNLSWERNWTAAVNTRLQLNHLLDRDFSDNTGAVTNSFDGYSTLDFYGEWQSELGDFQLGLQNLSNTDYFTYFSQTQGSDTRNFKGFGRSFSLTYSREF
ncbi:MAG: TonB-dependent receptor [Gammaproteobacteria bacterium]|nr:TonB-dependent receptor [Gammaproteobacteria bacterium]